MTNDTKITDKTSDTNAQKIEVKPAEIVEKKDLDNKDAVEVKKNV